MMHCDLCKNHLEVLQWCPIEVELVYSCDIILGIPTVDAITELENHKRNKTPTRSIDDNIIDVPQAFF